MTDDEILEAIERRFAGVETRLPPRRMAVAREAPIVARRTGPSVRGSGPMVALLAAVAVIATFAIVGRPTQPGVTTESIGGPSASTSASPSPSAQPTPGLVVVRAADPEQVLIAQMGWGSTICSADISFLGVDGAALDRAIDAAGIEEGAVALDQRRLWVGPTAESAAAGFGSQVVAIRTGGLEAWILVDGAGRRLMNEVTPKGRIAWWLGNSVRPGPCLRPSASPSASASPSLLILRGSHDGDSVLIEHFRWGPTICGGDASLDGPDAAAVDDAIDRLGSEEGWVDVPLAGTKPPRTARVWVGPTAESAATAHGASVLAFGGRGDTWIVVDGSGRQMVPFPTPKGRTFWLLTGGVSNGPCGAEPG